MADAEYTPEDSKKQPLFEIFRAVVWAPLVGREDLDKALETGKTAGVTDKDLETITEWDAKKLKTYFGEAAFNRDLVNAMKAADQFTSSMGSAFGYGGGAEFKKMGFY